MINNSKDLGVVPPVVGPEDIIKGNKQVNTTFVGEIFNYYYGLKDTEQAESKNPFLREEEETKQKVVTMKLNSMNIDE